MNNQNVIGTAVGRARRAISTLTFMFVTSLALPFAGGCSVSPPPPPADDLVQLEPGETATFDVVAKREWNLSGVELRAGRRYELRVVGDDAWKDGSIDATPGGFEKWYLTLFRPIRRHPSEPWFKLMAAVGSPEETYAVGGYKVITPESNGELLCYANDAPGTYRNNSGVVEVRVRALPAPK